MRAMFGSANTSEGGGISTLPERHLSGQNEIKYPQWSFQRETVGFLSTQHIFLSGLRRLGSKSSPVSMILDSNPKSTCETEGTKWTLKREVKLHAWPSTACSGSLPGVQESWQSLRQFKGSLRVVRVLCKIRRSLNSFAFMSLQWSQLLCFKKTFVISGSPHIMQNSTVLPNQKCSEEKNQMWRLQPHLCFCV